MLVLYIYIYIYSKTSNKRNILTIKQNTSENMSAKDLSAPRYFRIGGKDSSTKERIHDGRTWERKRSSLHHSGLQGTR